MNVVVLADEAKTYASRLEKGAAHRSGLTREQARADVARELGMTPGTLENINRGRLKDPDRIEGLVGRLRRAVVRELNEEITRLTHERDLLLATGADPRSDEMAEVEADLAKARQVLGLPPR